MNNATELQQRAINKLNRLKVGALFMEMGTGKTKVALDLMFYKSNKCDYFLWICPCSLKNEIEKEHELWQPNIKLQVVGVESIGSSDRIYLDVLNIVKEHKHVFCVVDESLKIKNIKAKRTIRLLEISKYCEYKLILNGTPLSKNVLDMYPQMQFLSPLILNENFYQFKDKYCEYYKCGELRGRIKRQHNIPHLISRIKPYIFDAELDLKTSKNYSFLDFKLNDDEQFIYDETKYNMLANMEKNNDIDFYILITTLQKIICTSKSKQDLVNSCINEIQGKVVIFVKYIASIPDNALKIIGDMNMSERETAIRKFKNEEKVLYITYGCGSFGLNLQFANNMIFADRTWDLAQREQAEARIYRLGQNEDIVNYYIINGNTGLDKIMKRSINKKLDMLETIKTTIADMNNKEKIKWLEKHL